MRPFHALMLGVFALTLFTSATLLFMIQPLVGKMMLPLLGGTPEVWNTCMVFFQAILLGGYAYAHASTKWIGVRWQSLVHLAVLSLPLVLFAFVSPLEINKRMIAGGEASPVLNVLFVLLISVGLPFFVVSTSAPLLQKWFSSTDHPSAADPYFLYGASNFGSMLSLLGYPLFIEPYLRVVEQRVDWAWGFGTLVLCIGGCVGLLWVSAPAKKEETDDKAPPPDGGKGGNGSNGASSPAPAAPVTSVVASSAPAETASAGRRNRKNRKDSERVSNRPPAVVMVPVGPFDEAALLGARSKADDGTIPLLRKVRWVLLGAVPVSLLMGVTTYMTTDIAAIPLLWIPPLALYLLTFIIVFASPAFQKVMMALYLFCHAVAIPYLLTSVGNSYLPEMTFIPWLLWLGLMGSSWLLLYVPSTGDYIHRGMILALPLLILLMIFIMLSDIGVPVYWKIILHLETMFVATMVCHGELARDRPSTKHLTEFFMLMSLGGVVGGIFNALFSPIAFNSLAEYPIALVVSCLLLPPLLAGGKAGNTNTPGTRRPDDTDVTLATGNPGGSWFYNVTAGGTLIELGMVVLFLVVGGLLIGLRLGDENLEFELITKNSYGWMLAAVIGAFLYGVYRIVMRTWLGPWSDYQRQLAKALPALGRLAVVGVVTLFIVIGSSRFGLNLKRDLDYPISGGFLQVLYTLWCWAEILVLLVLAAVGLYLALMGWRRPDVPGPDLEQRREQATRVLDGLLPVAIGVLSVGLIWGINSLTVKRRLFQLAQWEDWPLNLSQMRAILTYGIPAVLCYIFVERSRRFGLGVAALLMGAGFCSLLEADILLQKRSFFGVLKVEHREILRFKDGSQVPMYVTLVHGTTLHGKQFSREYLALMDLYAKQTGHIVNRDVPLTYYHRSGPLGQVFNTYSPDGLNDKAPPVGVIGLGTGTTASYGQPGQHMTYYDIDRLVKQISWDTDKYFTYISDARARGVVGIGINELKLNDARLAIDREVAAGVPEEDRFGILVVDAFSSDAIPIHLITKQAVQLFKQRVGPKGLICYHISNRYLDLMPVLANLAKDPDINLVGLYQNDRGDEEEFPGKAASTWVVLCSDKEHLNKLQYQENNFKNLFPGMNVKQPNLKVSRHELPRTLGEAFPEVAQSIMPMMVLPNPVPILLTRPNQFPQMQAIGLVVARQLEVPVWYELHRAEDSSVGVWTDDYASIPSVFTPLRRNKRIE